MQAKAGILLAAIGVSMAVWQAAAQGAAPVPKMTVAQKIAASREKLDINTATAAQLRALPGMGDAYVARIIAGRPYTAKNQLVQRGVLPQPVYSGISDLIIAHRPKAQP
jgi:DNA uptake protein ComE-like DNA-binding protein